MTEIDAKIDALTNSVVHRTTGQSSATRIVRWPELSENQKSEIAGWRFAWSREARRTLREVVALLVVDSNTVQGLSSIEAADGFMLVNLLESAPHNVGRNQLYRGVPGNLFAYACARSIALGFDGYVAFDAKTKLIEHYKTSLGAEQVGRSSRLVIDQTAALHLVEQYFKETDQWPW